MSLFSKNAFTSGELSPRMEGNNDTKEYVNGLKTLENFIILPQGGIQHRCGTKYVAEVADSSKNVRLIPFEFSEEDAYILEFGDRKIRLYKDTGQVNFGTNLITNPNFDTDISGWTDSSTGGALISWDSATQSMKLSTAVGGDHARASQAFTIVNGSTYAGLIPNCQWWDGATPGSGLGPIIYCGTAPGLQDIFSATYPGAFGLDATCGGLYIGATTTAYITIEYFVATATYFSLVDLPTFIDDSLPGELSAPWLDTDIDGIQFAQSNDVMYLTHPDYPPYKLIRASDVAWSLALVDMAEQPFNDITSTTTLTASVITKDVASTITASTSYFTASHVGSYFRLRDTTEESKPKPWRTSHGAVASILGEMEVTINDLVSWEGNTYSAITEGVTGNIPPTHTTGSVTDGSVQWLFVRTSYGVFKVTAFTSGTSVTALNITTLPHTSATSNWEEGEWNPVKGYPGSVCFYEERLWFAATYTKPQTLWGSKTADFENFDYGAGNPGDSVEYTIASNTSNRIQWLQPGRVLFIGTLGGEYVASGSSSEEAITPTNIRIVNHSRHGSKRIMPRLISNTAVFVQKAAKRIRQFLYRERSGGYVSNDVTLLSEHITGASGVKEIDYQQEPNSILWGVRNDGQLASSIYQTELGLNAWCRQIIGGVFGAGNAEVMSVAVIPTANADRCWLIVKRTINSATVQYVEYITEWNDVTLEDAIFMDSAITYDSTPATAMSGLSHLEGETVQILADGLVQVEKIVSSGAITLDTAASVVQMGLYKNATMETLSLNPQTLRGKESFQGQIKRISEVIMRFYNTIGGKLNGDTIESTAGTLYTGVKSQNYDDDYGYEARVKITQEEPLPMTILSLQPRAKEGR